MLASGKRKSKSLIGGVGMIKKLTALTGMLAFASFVATSAFAAPHKMSTKKSYSIAKKHHVTVKKAKHVTKPVTKHSGSGHH